MLLHIHSISKQSLIQGISFLHTNQNALTQTHKTFSNSVQLAHLTPLSVCLSSSTGDSRMLVKSLAQIEAHEVDLLRRSSKFVDFSPIIIHKPM